MNEDEEIKKRWYIIQAQSGYELKVRRHILDKIERESMQKYFGDIVVPTEEVVEIRAGGSKHKTDRKFFPGYVMINMHINDLTWHLVRNSDRVLGFVGGTRDKPTPLSPSETQKILSKINDENQKPKPKTIFEIGESVNVCDGPFMDFEGVVEDVDYEKNRLKVSVVIFGRSTPVDLSFSQVAKKL